MRFKKKQNTIAARLSLYAAVIILLQSLMLVFSLVGGGILSQSRETLSASFSDKVANRARYIQGEMDNRWTNIDPYYQEISRKLSETDIYDSLEKREQFLFDISETLVSMLRITGATGSFVILDDNEAADSRHSGVFFRDYDPRTNAESNRDIYLVLGPSQISERLQVPMDQSWSYSLMLNHENEEFYQKPYEASNLSFDYKKLGYWSKPFQMMPSDHRLITYSVPLYDHGGKAHGVIGVSISVENFKTLLPGGELAAQDSPGYMLTLTDENSDFLIPLISKGAYQKRILKDVKMPRFKIIDEEYGISQLVNGNGSVKIYGSTKPLTLYNSNTPYEREEWAITGLIEGDELFGFVNNLQQILLISFLGSLILGIVVASFISRKIAHPITEMADKVKKHDFTKEIEFEEIGLSEIDDLLGAIQFSNRNLLKSTVKMSQIMDLVDVRIGAFEYKIGEEKALVTNQVFEILDFEPDETGNLYVDIGRFLNKLNEVQCYPEPDEERVYLVQKTPEKWVEINMIVSDGGCLGVIRNVTAEIQNKHRMRIETDYDSLTKIYNRAAFQREVERRIGVKESGIAALVMFDLDNLKQINDTWGHEYGDIYIRETAARLSAFPKEHAIVGRRSGDEFYAFIYGLEDKSEIRELLSDFYQELGHKKIEFPGGELVQIQISAGLSWYEGDTGSYDELLNRSDTALYKIKHSVKGSLGEYTK